MSMVVCVFLSKCGHVCVFVLFSYLRSPCHAGVPATRPAFRARRRVKQKEDTHTHTQSTIAVSCLTAFDLEALNYS